MTDGRARKRKACCAWWLPIVLMVPLFFVVAGLSKGAIESGLAARARAALGRDGVSGVAVSASNWGDLRLSGPAAQRTGALAAVAAMGHRRDANHVWFTEAAGAPAPAATTTIAAPAAPATTTTVPATTTTVPATTVPPSTTTVRATTTTAAATTTTVPLASVDVTAAIAGTGVTLTGFVASDTERATVVSAAVAAFGPAHVVDQLVVRAGSPAVGIDAAVGRLAAVVTGFGARVETGRVRLVDTVLTVDGTAFTAQGATEANAAVASAASGGVTASGTVAAPAAPDRATLAARLKDLLGRSGINFASGSADITPESEAVLVTAAQSILAVPGAAVRIDGHTDNQGSAASNRTLSEQRAEAVRQNLIAKGVPAAQLTTQGFGPDQPIADNATDAGRAANRRIEFTVL